VALWLSGGSHLPTLSVHTCMCLLCIFMSVVFALVVPFMSLGMAVAFGVSIWPRTFTDACIPSIALSAPSYELYQYDVAVYPPLCAHACSVDGQLIR